MTAPRLGSGWRASVSLFGSVASSNTLVIRNVRPFSGQTYNARASGWKEALSPGHPGWRGCVLFTWKSGWSSTQGCGHHAGFPGDSRCLLGVPGARGTSDILGCISRAACTWPARDSCLEVHVLWRVSDSPLLSSPSVRNKFSPFNTSNFPKLKHRPREGSARSRPGACRMGGRPALCPSPPPHRGLHIQPSTGPSPPGTRSASSILPVGAWLGP